MEMCEMTVNLCVLQWIRSERHPLFLNKPVAILFFIVTFMLLFPPMISVCTGETPEQNELSAQPTDTNKENEQKDFGKKKRYFNINRLQYRTSLYRGQSSIQQSSFVTFPSGLFIVESIEWVAAETDRPTVYFLDVNFEATFGKPLKRTDGIGDIFSLLGRVQAGDNQETIISAGMHWDITKVIGIRNFAKRNKVASFLQIFPLKSKLHEGGTDIYYWLQIKGFSELTYIRGVVSYYLLPHRENLFYTFWDVIFPVRESFDLYVRYDYRNRTSFNFTSGDGLYLGARYNFKL